MVTVRYFAPGSAALNVSSTFCCSASRSFSSFVSRSLSPSRSSTFTGRASNPSDSTVTETLAVSPTATMPDVKTSTMATSLSRAVEPAGTAKTGAPSRAAAPAASEGDRPPVFWPSENRKRPATGRPAASSRTRPIASPMCVAGPPGSGGSANSGFAASTPSGAGSRAKV